MEFGVTEKGGHCGEPDLIVRPFRSGSGRKPRAMSKLPTGATRQRSSRRMVTRSLLQSQRVVRLQEDHRQLAHSSISTRRDPEQSLWPFCDPQGL